jgi:hypothetical protein
MSSCRKGSRQSCLPHHSLQDDFWPRARQVVVRRPMTARENSPWLRTVPYMRCKFKGDPILHGYVEERSGGRCGDCSNLHVKYTCWLGSSYPIVISGNSFAELFEAAAVCSMRLPQADRAGEEGLMAYRIRAHELATVTEARRELAAEARKLSGLLESQEPDYLGLTRCVGSAPGPGRGGRKAARSVLRPASRAGGLADSKAALARPETRVDRQPIPLAAVEGFAPKRKQKATHSSM